MGKTWAWCRWCLSGAAHSPADERNYVGTCRRAGLIFVWRRQISGCSMGTRLPRFGEEGGDGKTGTTFTHIHDKDICSLISATSPFITLHFTPFFFLLKSSRVPLVFRTGTTTASVTAQGTCKILWQDVEQHVDNQPSAFNVNLWSPPPHQTPTSPRWCPPGRDASSHKIHKLDRAGRRRYTKTNHST